jgi:outer membrane protein TolC
MQQVTAVARASAAAAVASAELEIAQRGLVATVVGLYYGSLAADHKVAVAQRALTEASNFTSLTKHREDGSAPAATA